MADVRDHVIDGIEEYDNPLPRWWVYLFLFTIAIALVYAVVYPSFWFWGGSSSWSQVQQYEQEMAAAATRFADPAESVDLEALSKDPAMVAAGKEIFVKNCQICHGERGEGKIGPRLYGPTWKYGGDAKSMLASIRLGRPGGMPAWSKQGLNLEAISKVGAFAYSLRYTAPK